MSVDEVGREESGAGDGWIEASECWKVEDVEPGEPSVSSKFERFAERVE